MRTALAIVGAFFLGALYAWNAVERRRPRVEVEQPVIWRWDNLAPFDVMPKTNTSHTN
jgi:hypothetical protein